MFSGGIERAFGYVVDDLRVPVLLVSKVNRKGGKRTMEKIKSKEGIAQRQEKPTR